METFRIPKGNTVLTETLARIESQICIQAQRHRVKVVVQMDRADRSEDQNEALWGLAYKILHQETGNDPEDMHDYFLGEFFGWVEYEVIGMRKKKPRRTTTKNAEGKREVLDTMSFANFFSFIQQRSAETVGVHIPDPDKNWRQNQEHAA
jgi:hypothetical protein